MFIVSVAVLSFFGYMPNEEFFTLHLIALVAIPMLMTLWLILFNSGSSRTDEYSIAFTDNGINYSHMGLLETIMWSNYTHFKVSGIYNKRITISGGNKAISFDFHLFNTKQQKGIIAKLNDMS